MEIEEIEFSLIDLVGDILDMFRELTRAKGISIRADLDENCPNWVISDPTRLRQILINIIGNAVKFTEKGAVSLRVTTENQGARTKLKISVEDTGIGLTELQREKLFQPFVQADNSTTRKFGGTGLGLALSMRLANALGGSIAVESNASGQGCRFDVEVNVGKLKEREKQIGMANDQELPRGPSKPLAGLFILVADDSADSHFLTVRMLKKLGAATDSAYNGIEAFRMAMKTSYDAVLMDVQMPEMDGYEATRSLREAGFKVPIIALTAHAMAEERALTLAAGYSGHLTKPLSMFEFQHTILKHIVR